MSDNFPHEPLPGELEEAKKVPNGWVYRISGNFKTSDRVPPEAIIGAWKVDSEGNITGDFRKNPVHKDGEEVTKKKQDDVRS